MTVTIETSRVTVDDAELLVRSAGPVDAPPLILLHGWPEDGRAFDGVIEHAAERFRCVAPDLPGAGGSTGAELGGGKAALAQAVHDLTTKLKLSRPVVVGHDVGGMVAFAYLKQFVDLRAAVIMDTVVPGVDPWQSVLSNPWIWHFAFHSIPELPERLVRHETGAYFDFFFDAISANPSAISADRRASYVESYSTEAALTQGFEFYRAFAADAEWNAAQGHGVPTPVLYLRGEHEGGDLSAYEAGFRAAGLDTLATGVIPGSGHFAPEENPEAVWQAIDAFLAAYP